jgi:hypothetical protein
MTRAAVCTAASYRYAATCTRCNALVVRFAAPLGDEPVTAMLEHLWPAHPDVLRRPATLPLGELLRLFRVRHADR